MTRFVVLAAFLAALAGLAAPLAAAPGDTRVPEVIDLSAAAAQAEIVAGGFVPELRAAPPGGGANGTIGRQEPGGFAFAPRGTTVALYVRGGPATGPVAPPPLVPPPSSGGPGTGPDAAAPVPDVVGKSESEAIDALAGWRITILTVDSVPENAGRVTNQTPAAGSALPPDGVVEISVGRAAAPGAPSGTATVPTVLGLDEATANRTLTAAGLVPLVQQAATSDPAKVGRVVGQEPEGGVLVARNSNVVLSVGRMAATPLNEAEVPDCVRSDEGTARRRLLDAGFPVVVKDRLASAADAGIVLEQEPAPMSRLLRGRTVSLTVGRLLLLPIAVPDVMNVDAAAAQAALQGAGFRVETLFADTTPSSVGKVVSQEPPGGTTKVRDSFVRITVGRGSPAAPTTLPVPNLVGASVAAAEAELSARGLTIRRTIVATGPESDGRVLSQTPAPGTPAAPGTAVTLTVGRTAAPPPGVPLPSYVNMDVATAQADLQQKGLRVSVVYATGAPDGRVLAQSPEGGVVTVRGALVTLTVARAPQLGVPALLEPDHKRALPKNHGVVFTWTRVPGADDYQIEVMSFKDGAWQRENIHDVRDPVLKVKNARKGFYQWHVRARRAGGTVEGAWSEWRSLTVY